MTSMSSIRRARRSRQTTIAAEVEEDVAGWGVRLPRSVRDGGDDAPPML
jgi:hypothetical protein